MVLAAGRPPARPGRPQRPGPADDGRPQGEALVSNFAGQWLEIRLLDDWKPDPAKFPAFDDALRTAMKRETEMFFQNLIREDRAVTELLGADYTFVNERLAKHYGIKGVTGDEFRKVPPGRHAPRRRPDAGERADRHRDAHPHQPNEAREIFARADPRHPVAPAAQRRAGAEREAAGRDRRVAPQAAGNPPRQPQLLRLPPAARPARVRDGELRRHRRAGATRTGRFRSTRAARCPTARRSTARTPCGRC